MRAGGRGTFAMARVRRSLEDQSYSKTPKSAAGDQATTGSGRKYSVPLGRSMEVAPQSEGKAPHEQPPAWNQLLQLAMDQQSTIMDFHEETEEERAAHRAVARQAVKEICIYSLFLMFFSLSSILVVQDQSLFFFGSKVHDQFTKVEWMEGEVEKHFGDIEIVGQIHMWLQGPLFQTLYTDSSTSGAIDTQSRPGFIGGVNKVVGGVRIGQNRVLPRDCSESSKLVSKFVFTQTEYPMRCYGDSSGGYSDATESKISFGSVGSSTSTVFEWAGTGTEDASLDDVRARMMSDVRTGTGRVYPHTAFGVVLPNSNRTEAWGRLKELEEASYIDEATRLMTVEVLVYSPSLDLWCLLVFTLEQDKSGGVIPSSRFQTVRLFSMLEKETAMAIGLEAIVAAFFIAFIFRELVKICKQGKSGLKYLFKASTLAHNANLLAFVGVYMLRALSLWYLPSADTVVVDGDTFYNFRTAAEFRNAASFLQSLNAFLSFFKLVQFCSYIPRFALVTNTLYYSASGVSGFFLIFVVVFYGFCGAFLVAFGRTLSSYRNLTSSAFTLLRSLLGDFNMQELVGAHWLLGFVLFTLFVGVNIFVVLNTLIAIISDAYTLAREEVENSVNVQLGSEIYQVVRGWLLSVCPCMRRAISKAEEVAAKKAKRRSDPASGDSPSAGAKPGTASVDGSTRPRKWSLDDVDSRRAARRRSSQKPRRASLLQKVLEMKRAEDAARSAGAAGDVGEAQPTIIHASPMSPVKEIVPELGDSKQSTGEAADAASPTHASALFGATNAPRRSSAPPAGSGSPKLAFGVRSVPPRDASSVSASSQQDEAHVPIGAVPLPGGAELPRTSEKHRRESLRMVDTLFSWK